MGPALGLAVLLLYAVSLQLVISDAQFDGTSGSVWRSAGRKETTIPAGCIWKTPELRLLFVILCARCHRTV